MKPNLQKILNYIIIVAQMLLLVVAIEVGGWWLVIYLIINGALGIWWSYKHWFMIRTFTDYILGKQLGVTFLNGKVMKDVKRKHKKDNNN
jgi:hypothetical protein